MSDVRVVATVGSNHVQEKSVRLVSEASEGSAGELADGRAVLRVPRRLVELDHPGVARGSWLKACELFLLDCCTSCRLSLLFRMAYRRWVRRSQKSLPHRLVLGQRDTARVLLCVDV